MVCPECGKKDVSRVIDSRNRENAIYRRRECTVCGCRFSTLERFYKVRRKTGKDGKRG